MIYRKGSSCCRRSMMANYSRNTRDFFPSRRSCNFRVRNGQGNFNKSYWNKVVDHYPPILNEPAAFWEISCDCEMIDSEGLTEKDRVWIAAKELVAKNILIQASYKVNAKYSTTHIKCFIENYSDLDKVIQSAKELKRRIQYIGVFYLKTCCPNDIGENPFRLKYLYCYDEDLYERCFVNQTGYRLLKRNSSNTHE